MVVWLVIYLLIAGAVFGLLLFLVNYIASQFPSEPMAMFAKLARICLVVLAVLVAISILLSLAGGPTIFRWGPPHVP